MTVHRVVRTRVVPRGDPEEQRHEELRRDALAHRVDVGVERPDQGPVRVAGRQEPGRAEHPRGVEVDDVGVARGGPYDAEREDRPTVLPVQRDRQRAEPADAHPVDRLLRAGGARADRRGVDAHVVPHRGHRPREAARHLRDAVAHRRVRIGEAGDLERAGRRWGAHGGAALAGAVRSTTSPNSRSSRPASVRARARGSVRDDETGAPPLDLLDQPADEPEHHLDPLLGRERLEGVDIDEGAPRRLQRGAEPAPELPEGERLPADPGPAGNRDHDRLGPADPDLRRPKGDDDEAGELRSGGHHELDRALRPQFPYRGPWPRPRPATARRAAPAARRPIRCGRTSGRGRRTDAGAAARAGCVA